MWMDKLIRIDECVTIGRCKITRLFFARGSALLASFESGLLHGLNGFVAACDIAGVKISNSNTEELHLLKSCLMFSASWRWIIEAGREVQVSWGCINEWWKIIRRIGCWSGKASAVILALHYSVVLKRELSMFKSIFVPIITYSHESSVITERVRSQVRNEIFAKNQRNYDVWQSS